MKLTQPVGITSYGTYLPQFAILAEEIELAQGKVASGIPQSLGVKQKTVADFDQDTAVLSVAAAAQALERMEKTKPENSDPTANIGALFIGSESHPYAVKPTGTIVAQALGLPQTLAMADLQFACKAGTQSLQIVAAYVAAGMIERGLAIGADTAQSRPGDILEFSAGAGAAAFILGRAKKDILANIIATTSVATDTPDFWRRHGQPYPEHAGRFTGEPAYFAHVTQATQQLLAEAKLKPEDIDYCVFHTPNAKFPRLVAAQLGFTPSQLVPSLVVAQIGNTYAAASLLALAAVLDQASADQKILVTSYGSGSGADSFLLQTTKHLPARRKRWMAAVRDQIAQLEPISYQSYREKTNHGD
jgi:hydroxymethylglutaryl-CoA synthase